MNYISGVTADKRSASTWTLDRMAGDYASRMEELVRKSNPNWKPGDAFDTSVLDQLDGTLGVDFKARKSYGFYGEMRISYEYFLNNQISRNRKL